MSLLAINKFQDFKDGLIFGLGLALIILIVIYLYKKFITGKY